MMDYVLYSRQKSILAAMFQGGFKQSPHIMQVFCVSNENNENIERSSHR